MKQSSIEWLIDQFELSHSYINEIFKEDIAKAKQMHKEEIIGSWKDAEGYNDENGDILAKQYYNKTYKK